MKKKVTKKFGVDFISDGGALTLRTGDVSGELIYGTNVHTKTHESGWTIQGEIQEDYYEWVNDFKATHPHYGKVVGNFERKVWASSEEAFTHFWDNHEPEAWDYQDI